MTYLDALILGVVEGITEFLPISSTGHLILTSTLLGLSHTEFVKTFEIAIQLGSICAVVFIYWRKFLDIDLLKKLFVGFLPTALIGFTLYKVIKSYLIGNELVVVWALALGGVALIVFELLHKESDDATQSLGSVSYKQSFLIGLFQSIAMIPGVSRSAATIVGGLLVGLNRATIVEFSFLLAVPTMAAATGLDLLKSASAFTSDEFGILAVGFLAAFAVALVAIKFLLSFVRNHTFIPFGIYRIIVAVLFLLFVL